MKNIAFLLLVWLSAFNFIYAQEKQKRMALGVTTGLTYSIESISNADDLQTGGNGSEPTRNGRAAYAFGLVSNFKISKNFFLTAQIACSKTRTSTSTPLFQNDSDGNSGVTLQKNNSYSWILIPLVLKYQFLSHRNYNLFAGLGASPNWLAKAKSKITFDTYNETILDATSSIKRVNLFGVAQTGIGFDLKFGGKILVLLEYHRSLFSLLKKAEPTSPGVFDYATSYPTINLNIFTLRTCFVY
jgi:hypothetical protein